jgi:hypothetical protein
MRKDINYIRCQCRSGTTRNGMKRSGMNSTLNAFTQKYSLRKEFKVMEMADKKIEYKNFVCKRIRLYTYLKEQGFKESKVRPDRNNPHYVVWIFENNERLQQAIGKFYSIGY